MATNCSPERSFPPHRSDAASVDALAGPSPLYAAQVDQRFSLCLYQPSGSQPAGMLIAVHGTERDAVGMRDAFVPFAERANLAIMAPLFPAGIDDPANLDNYKFIGYRGIRFDDLLLAMIGEAAERLGLRQVPPLYLHGFSGGAQFAHRFFYLHPAKLKAVSIAAPGRITELDDSIDWWHGTANVDSLFGTRVHTADLATVPVHVVVGGNDATPAVDRTVLAARLAGSLRANGIDTRFDIVDGVAHRLGGLVPATEDFFQSVMNKAPRQEGAGDERARLSNTGK